MTKILGRYLIVLLLLLPTTMLFVGQSKISSNVAFADDSMEGEEEEEATVETDEGAAEPEDTDSAVTDQEKQEEEEEEKEEEDSALKPSPDASTVILFTKPAGNGQELPAGKVTHFLVGFTNKGYGEFTVHSVEASLRYPQDYSYHIQNFTALTLNQVVPSKQQVTFAYSFTPTESFSSRPFGLTILINYKDGQDTQFQSAVFNETIKVVESEEGLDGETFFMYVFLAALAILLLVGVQQLVSSVGKKRLSKPKAAVEMGTQNTDIDYDWIPKETIKDMKRSPGRSPKQSPRQRRSHRYSGSAEE